jgi:hypothetical protein
MPLAAFQTRNSQYAALQHKINRIADFDTVKHRVFAPTLACFECA